MERVEKKLIGTTATRQDDGSWDLQKTGSERFKEYVKDKEELAGRGSRRAGDDRWEGKVLRVEELRMGLIKDQDNKLHSLTKVQPVPSTTRSTKTVLMERGVLGFRKARNDEACRAFIRDKVVPALRNQPERMKNTRILYEELGLSTGGREAKTLQPNQKLFERHIGGGQSFVTQRIFDSVFPDMFQVRVYSKNTKLVKMISADLPERESDPPDKNEVTGLTPDDLTRGLWYL